MFSRFVRMSTLFGISIQHFFFHLFFFFKAVFLPSLSLLKIWWEPFLFSSFWHFPFLLHFFFFFFFSILFFLLLWILAQTTTLKQTDQISSWNTMDKGFKKERLLKDSMGWLAIMYQERKRKTHIWLKVDKNCLISSLKD